MTGIVRGLALLLGKSTELVARLAFALLLTTLVIAAIAASLARNEEFTRFVLQDLIPQFTDDIEFGDSHGALLSDNFHLESMRYSDQAGSQLQVAGVALQWSPAKLWQKEISVQRLHIESVDVTPATAPEQSEQQASEPLALNDIQLPISLNVDELSVGRVTVNQGQEAAPLEVEQFLAGIRAEESNIQLTGLRSRITQAEIATEIQADLSLTTTGDWPIVGQLNAGVSGLPIESIAVAPSENVALQLTLQQSLRQLQFQLQAAAGGGELIANGQLALLEPALPTNLALQAQNFRLKQGELELAPSLDMQLVGNMDDGWTITGVGSTDLVDHQAPFHARYEFKEINIGVDSSEVALRQLLLDVNLPDAPTRTLRITGSSNLSPPYVATLELRGLGQVDSSYAVVEANWSGNSEQLPNATLDLTVADLANWLPTGKGRVQLAGELSTTDTASTIKAKGAVDGVRWASYQIANASLHAVVNLSDGGETNLVMSASDVGAAGTTIDSAEFVIAGTTTNHQLSATISSKQVVLNTQLAGGASYNTSSEIDGWNGVIDAFEATHPQLGSVVVDRAAQLKFNPQHMELRDACLSLTKVQQASVCLDGQLLGNGQLSASLSKLELPLASVAAFVDGLQARGVLSGRGAVSGNVNQLDSVIAELSLVVSEGGFAQAAGTGGGEIALFDFKRGDASVSYLNGMLINQLALQEESGGYFSAEASGRFASSDVESLMNSPIDVKVDADNLPLGWLKQGLPDVGELEGTFAIDLTVSGTPNQPVPQGEVTASGNQLTVPLAGLSLKEWSLVARPDGDRFDANLTLLAEDGGRLESSFAGHWQSGGEITGSVTGKAFPLYQTADAQIWADPKLKLSYGAEKLTVNGEVEVNKALIAPTISLESSSSAISVSSDQVVVNEQGEAINQGSALPIAADIAIKFGDDVRVKAYGLETRLGGRLQVIESPGRLTRARGEITLVDGQYAAFGQPLKIKRGALLYQNTVITQPSLDVTAVREFDEVTVGVNARGTLDEPELELFSTPTLSQSDQLSWLVLGRPFDRESGDSDSDDALAKATRALQLQGAEFLTGKLSNRLGIEDVSLESTDDGQGSALVLGKYLSPKLYLSYGLGLFDARNQLKLKYTISRDWSFEAASDGIDSGGDILFHVEK